MKKSVYLSTFVSKVPQITKCFLGTSFKWHEYFSTEKFLKSQLPASEVHLKDMPSTHFVIWGKVVCLVFLFTSCFAFQSTLVSASVANITQTAFTTSAQTVATSAVSEKLTIQTQNTGGTEEQLDETADLTLGSSSATGEFSSSATTWNPDTVITMSKNSANRSFYYKDSVDGTYTITATLLTRTTQKSWTTTQTIIVGTGGSGGGTTSTTTDTTTATTTDSTIATSTASIVGSTSSHSSGSSIARDPEPIEFEIFGGRDRLAMVGAPVTFQAKIVIIKNVSSPSRYLWSFGDGSAHDGAKVDHTYLIPGEYAVVLNADAYESNAVWRGRVTVVSPDFSISTSTPEYIEVWNKSAFESNLNGWKIQNGKESFTFPLDTIIPAHKKVAFPYQVTKVSSGPDFSLELYNPSLRVVTSWKAPVLANVPVAISTNLALTNIISGSALLTSASSAEDIDILYKKAIAMRDEWEAVNSPDVKVSENENEVVLPRQASLALVESSVQKQAKTVVEIEPEEVKTEKLAKVLVEEAIPEKVKNIEPVSKGKGQTASAITILPESSETTRGFFGTIMSWPGRSFRFVRDLVF